ncbi:hypothetical protein B5X24_HaOG209277 [Helicoverpa armigera]|nr:hypothetical protein B5X24_HaOG209277 [Helicoverpa armigera]
MVNLSSVHTNVLWYLEFFAFVFILIGFFLFFLYLASLNYVRYGPKYDFKKKKVTTSPRVRRVVSPRRVRPVCCDVGCIWFCGIIFSILAVISFILASSIRF